MTNELKEPGWSPPEIPGLVRKKGRKNESVASPPVATPVPVPEAPPSPPAAKAAPVAAPAAAATIHVPAENVKVISSPNPTANIDPGKAHEELMQCLATARTVIQRLQAAADSYYILCDYMGSDDAQPYVPAIDSIMRALHNKDPQLVHELIDTQAQEIIGGWLALSEAADQAVGICKMLTQASRAATIDAELREVES